MGDNATNLTIYVNVVKNENGEKALKVKTQKNEKFYTRYLPLISDFSTLKIYSRGGDGGNGGNGDDGGRGGNRGTVGYSGKAGSINYTGRRRDELMSEGRKGEQGYY